MSNFPCSMLEFSNDRNKKLESLTSNAFVKLLNDLNLDYEISSSDSDILFYQNSKDMRKYIELFETLNKRYYKVESSKNVIEGNDLTFSFHKISDRVNFNICIQISDEQGNFPVLDGVCEVLDNSISYLPSSFSNLALPCNRQNL